MGDTRRDERHGWYVKRFLEAAGIDASGVRSREAGSSFLLEDAGEETEVRVVELLRPPGGGDREGVREFRRALTRETERRWSDRDGAVPVEVWLEFSGHEQTTSARDRATLAEELCELVAGELPEPDAFARIVPRDPGGNEEFPIALSGITVARLTDYTASSWHVAAGAPAKAVEPDGVRAAVERASTAAAADPRPERRWLLLVADSFRLTGDPRIAGEVTGETYGGRFDRIDLFDPVTGETTSLRTGTKDAGG